jgi:hypothetical protein
MSTAKGSTATEGPKAAQETTETSMDINNMDGRYSGNTINRKDFNHSRDISNSKDPNNSKDANNIKTSTTARMPEQRL